MMWEMGIYCKCGHRKTQHAIPDGIKRKECHECECKKFKEDKLDVS